MVFGSSLPSSIKKNVVRVGSPLTKLSGSAHVQRFLIHQLKHVFWVHKRAFSLNTQNICFSLYMIILFLIRHFPLADYKLRLWICDILLLVNLEWTLLLEYFFILITWIRGHPWRFRQSFALRALQLSTTDRWLKIFSVTWIYFSILINWTSPFPILGLLSVCFFIFIQILKETSNSDAAFCGAWSGFALFADVPQKGR